MRLIVLCLLIVLVPLALGAQESKLAEQYYQNGEYEKAGTLYEKLFKDFENQDFYFTRYLDCLTALQQYDKARTVLEKQIKKRPKEVNLYVTYGNLFEKQGNTAEAEKQYQKAIQQMPADQFLITKLGTAFRDLAKYDLAIETYERGGVLIKSKQAFAYYLGELYNQKGDKAKMIDSYLNIVDEIPDQAQYVKSMFQRSLQTDEDYAELQSQLYARLQDKPEAIHFIDLLTWVFIQKKDYKNAFRQSKALDTKLEENGSRIFNLAYIAANDKDYDAAVSCYEYIVSQKGKTNPYYLEAKQRSLNCKRSKVVEGYAYTTADLRALEAEYEGFLNEYGWNRTTARIILELADLEGLYLNDLPKATRMLNDLIAYPGIDRLVQANAKLSLADYNLMQGERWEATLLYSQVDKDFKDDPMGHEARFRNAKLSYYFGDFVWAQAQFDVLKASTSKLIANDALDLSVFIMDNTGLDSTEVPLKMYAEAELLVFQNRFEEAFQKLDSIVVKFPGHTLDDDILWLKAQVNIKKRDYVRTAEQLQKIISDFGQDIRADNALYTLAGLYANPAQLNDRDKAKTLYEKLFTDFSNSTYAVDARKQFRILRGDKVQ